ncbi:hypothetical protein J8273_0056 [Carpediemonas membranifera]|uniref:Uncharacterized protein n=1 Tax=Carpediemonas membranifera TaxID=201153 RepID=A0A8J6B5S1_9EUKA|nr:hypothetical protein J8273_0056 [Carpediemonas membranifera]|eukprot:KAG9394849.1 hypothetical protein J8273_0056 [Carpediemonas membranifera]
MSATFLGLGIGLWIIAALTVIFLVPAIVAFFTPWRKRLISSLIGLYAVIVGILIFCPRDNVTYPTYDVSLSSAVDTLRYICFATAVIGLLVSITLFMRRIVMFKQIVTPA